MNLNTIVFLEKECNDIWIVKQMKTYESLNIHILDKLYTNDVIELLNSIITYRPVHLAEEYEILLDKVTYKELSDSITKNSFMSKITNDFKYKGYDLYEIDTENRLIAFSEKSNFEHNNNNKFNLDNALESNDFLIEELNRWFDAYATEYCRSIKEEEEKRKVLDKIVSIIEAGDNQ